MSLTPQRPECKHDSFCSIFYKLSRSHALENSPRGPGGDWWLLNGLSNHPNSASTHSAGLCANDLWRKFDSPVSLSQSAIISKFSGASLWVISFVLKVVHTFGGKLQSCTESSEWSRLIMPRFVGSRVDLKSLVCEDILIEGQSFDDNRHFHVTECPRDWNIIISQWSWATWQFPLNMYQGLKLF
jgi:hypothetical protein